MTSRDEQSAAFLDSDTIGDEFFIGIVESKLKISRDDFKLRLVLLSPATGKNENYASVLYRAKIKIEITATKERKSVDVIVKALLTTIKEMKEFSVFPRERLMYEDILSSFEKIWLDGTGEVIQLGPRSIKFETDPYEIIVLDDLKADGYEMLNRRVGLNKEQTKMILTKLAKFHAISAVRYQKDGVISARYFDRKISMPPMPQDSPMVQGFMKLVKAFGQAIRDYGGYDVYADKIQNWDMENFMAKFLDIAEPMPSGFQVLSHGDLWLNNMMFKSDAIGNPLDVSMIDFQMSFWGSPVADLIYFLVSSVSDDIKVDCFDEFIEFYHIQLTDALKKLKYDKAIPSLPELQIDLLNKGSFACSCLMFILFVVKYDSPEEILMENLLMGGDNPEMYQRVYYNDIYKKAVTLWLPFLNNRGFLDTLLKSENAKPSEEKKEE